MAAPLLFVHLVINDMRNLAQIPSETGALDLWRALPQWINLHHSRDGDRSYAVKEIMQYSRDALTLTTDMTGSSGLIASYKCDISLIFSPGKSWLVFSPLVVIWEMGRAERGPDLGRVMIEHFVSAVRAFQQAHADSSYGMVIASGNLTVAKGGKPFFESIGWEIVFPEAQEPGYLFHGEEAMAKPLAAIEAQIEAAIAPLRAAGKVEEKAISFAILRLT